MNPGSETFLVKVAVFGGLVIGAALAIKYAAGKAADALPGSARALADAVNPLSNENVFYKGASAAVSAVTGNDLPLGVQLWEWINPGQATIDNQIIEGGSKADPAKLLQDTQRDTELMTMLAGQNQVVPWSWSKFRNDGILPP